MLEWVSSNRSWLFDGALVAVPLALIGMFGARAARSRSTMVRQRQEGGANSSNTQVGIVRTTQPQKDLED